MRAWVLICSIVALVAAGSAQAAIAPVFGRSVARVGEMVSVRQPGVFQPGCGGSLRGIRLYLITERQARHLVSIIGSAAPRHPPAKSLRRHPLGELRCDRHGVLRLRFRVPAVPPGRYTTLVHCTLCGGTWIPGGFLAKNGVLRVRR